MKIAPVLLNNQNNKKNTSFKSASFINYNNEFYSIKSRLQSEINNFSDGYRSNVALLGEGKFGAAYKFKSPGLTNIVIKTTKGSYKDDYQKEYENLVLVPTDKIGGQAGVGRAYDSKGNYYLLSTLTEGREVSEYNRYTDSHLKSLFTKMFELDKVGLYHGDLNGKNILLTRDGKINFIDYQWAQRINSTNFFDSEKSQKILHSLPNFPENAQMFEMATMPYYIESIGSKKEKEDFLKMYLKNKAAYHEKRYNYIKQITANWPYSSERSYIRDSLAMELAKSKVYKNPTDAILKIELKKFQFLSDYRDAFGHVDPHILDRNILASTSSYICSISAVQDFRKEIAKQLSYCTDSDMREYLRAQADYGEYWYQNLRRFSSDTFDYIIRTITNDYNSTETRHKFYKGDRNPRLIKQNKEILEAVDSRFQTSFDRNFSVPYDLQTKMHNIFSVPMNSIKKECGSNEKAYHRRKKIQNAYNELKNFNREGKVLDLLNTAEVISLKAREFARYTYHNMNSTSLDRRLEILAEQSVNLTQNIYNTIMQGLSEPISSRIIVQGYKNMRKFAPKI